MTAGRRSPDPATTYSEHAVSPGPGVTCNIWRMCCFPVALNAHRQVHVCKAYSGCAASSGPGAAYNRRVVYQVLVATMQGLVFLVLAELIERIIFASYPRLAALAVVTSSFSTFRHADSVLISRVVILHISFPASQPQYVDLPPPFVNASLDLFLISSPLLKPLSDASC